MRNNKLLFIFLITLLTVVCCLPSFSQVNTSIETKISIETNLEERLRKVLTEICGTDKLIVIVNAELYGEKEKPEQIKLKEKEKRPKVVLPGVPFRKNIAERKLEELLAPLYLGKTKTLIKRIFATVIIDKSVSAGVVEIAKKITIGLLGLNFERGDKLTFERMNFQKNPFYWALLFRPPYIFWLIGIILAAIFVGGAMFSLFGPFRKYSGSFVDTVSRYLTHKNETETAPETFWGQHMQGMPVQTALAGPGAGMGNVTQGSLTREKEKRPFSFLKPEHFSRLEDYVKEETPENIAIIMNYLGSQEATRVFASLTGDQQSEVATHIASSGQISPDVVKSLEQKVKNAIEYSFGGEEMVGTLLDYADKKTQTKVLGILKKRDEALASRLRKSVFSFEDIANLSSQAINIIVRRTNLAVFAQIAKTMPDEFKNKVLESLPQAARKRLEQEIELGRPISDSRIREEKMRIIGIVRRLQQEGLIDIGGKGDDRGVNS